MAARATADTRVGQVVKRRRYPTGGPGSGSKVGVAFQALLGDLRAGQHARIRRSVRFMTGGTTFHSHWSMLECERSALVAMATQASGLIRGDIPECVGQQPAVWIVAIDATDAAFLELMPVRALELGDGGDVACAAIGHVILGLRLMHAMATGAGHLITGVTATDGADARGLIQMATETNAIGLRRRQTQWVTDVAGCGRFRMGASWPMAAFAGFFRETMLGIGLHPVVWTLCKRLKKFFVAALANDAPHVLRSGFFLLPH